MGLCVRGEAGARKMGEDLQQVLADVLYNELWVKVSVVVI